MCAQRGLCTGCRGCPNSKGDEVKIGHPKRKQSYSNDPFSGAMLVSGRVCGSRGERINSWAVHIVMSK